MNSSKFTFHNQSGSRVIDCMSMSHDCVLSLIKGLTVENFNTFSCHAPLNVEIYVKDDKYSNNDHCKFCCNEGFK